MDVSQRGDDGLSRKANRSAWYVDAPDGDPGASLACALGARPAVWHVEVTNLFLRPFSFTATFTILLVAVGVDCYLTCKLLVSLSYRGPPVYHPRSYYIDVSVAQGICYVTNPSYIREARREWERRTNNAIVEYVVVPELPKGAMVEWQIWAHRGNTRFECELSGCDIDWSDCAIENSSEFLVLLRANDWFLITILSDEETGCVVGENRVSLKRRWNYDNTVSAIVCNISAG